jgi:hypothetical protein
MFAFGAAEAMSRGKRSSFIAISSKEHSLKKGDDENGKS